MVALNFHGAQLILQVGLLVLLITTHSILSSSSSAAAAALPGCSDRCGDVEILYPFGMSENCSLNDNFFINCSKSTGYNPIYGKNLRVTKVSTDSHEMTIMWYVAKDCFNESDRRMWSNKPWLNTPSLSISNSKNKFVVFGCDSYAYLQGMHKENSSFSMGCMSICEDKNDVPDDGSCSGIGCCQVDIPKGLKYAKISPWSFKNHTNVKKFYPCTYAFVVKRTQFNFSRNFLGHFSETEMPVVVDWAIDYEAKPREASSGKYTKCGRENTILEFTPDRLQYDCKCKEGYRGNAYLPAGCQTDIDECNSGVHNCTKH